jgi:hypothetical protein
MFQVTNVMGGAVLIFIMAINGPLFAMKPFVRHDQDTCTAEIRSGDETLTLRINYNKGCFIDKMMIGKDQVLDKDNGISAAVEVNGYWHLSKHESKPTRVRIDGNTVKIEGIGYGPDTFKINETWTFTATENTIDWHIERTIPADRTVNAAANSHWEFAGMDTWTGAVLDNGGAAWSKMLPSDFETFGNHAGKVVFWNHSNGTCFEVNPIELDGRHMASRFTRSPRGTLVFAQTLSDASMETRVNLSRYLRNDSIWKPFVLHQGHQSMTYRLSVSDLETRYDLGCFNGIDEDAVREILNTIVRYGVIDSKLCGANGWRTGYICLHEQWYAQMAMALQDDHYTRNLSDTYDHFRDHAVLDSGRVLARFKDNSADAMPGTYNEQGFYEAQWGYLLDSQPDYVMVVSEQFHNTSDLDWVCGQQKTCRAALEYMLKRDSDGDGLLEMINSDHSDARGSDWIDIVWAAHENALVNAEMYQALNLWAEIEEILGDHEKAERYYRSAAKLKDSFNKDISDGGFWNPDKHWYIYWRDKDDSIHGDNFVVPVNFAAIGYGLCDDENRKTSILSGLEEVMQKEGLFSWPLCVYSFRPEEAAASNFPFPSYENGDIFLSWAELGTRVYAAYDPDIAMKYINNIIAQYKRDGLAFQRYGRRSQSGLGDDILAGNGMAVVGLYRNIFGIQPRYNRLYLEPHVPAALNDTEVKYRLRGRDYHIVLRQDRYTASANDFSIDADGPFGMSTDGNRLAFYHQESRVPSLVIERAEPIGVEVSIAEVGGSRFTEWSIQSDKSTRVVQTICGLSAGAPYSVRVNADDVTEATADGDGCLRILADLESGSKKVFVILSVAKGEASK